MDDVGHVRRDGFDGFFWRTRVSVAFESMSVMELSYPTFVRSCLAETRLIGESGEQDDRSISPRFYGPCTFHI